MLVCSLLLTVTFLLFPEGEVLSEELDDGLGVTEGFLVAVVKLVEGILEGLVA